jgi:hypothetical protein
MTIFWDVAITALMMDALSTSETSVNFYQTTRRNIPEEGTFILATLTTRNIIYITHVTLSLIQFPSCWIL